MTKQPTPLEEYDKDRVGRRLRFLLEAKGLSQKLASDLIGRGMTPQKLNNFIQGRDLIPVHWAGRVCAITGANFSYIYGGDLGSLPTDLAQAIINLGKDPVVPPKPRRVRRRG